MPRPVRLLAPLVAVLALAASAGTGGSDHTLTMIFGFGTSHATDGNSGNGGPANSPYSAGFPDSGSTQAFDGASQSTTNYTLENDFVDYSWSHQRDAMSNEAFSSTTFRFTSDKDVDYIASGSYSMSSADDGFIEFNARLEDVDNGGTLFRSEQDSAGVLSESFVLGGNDGQSPVSTGTLVGTLEGGNVYHLALTARIAGTPSSNATAAGSGDLLLEFVPATQWVLFDWHGDQLVRYPSIDALIAGTSHTGLESIDETDEFEAIAYDGEFWMLYDRDTRKLQTYSSLRRLVLGSRTHLRTVSRVGFEGIASDRHRWVLYDRDGPSIVRYPSRQDLIDDTNSLGGVEPIVPTGYEEIGSDGESWVLFDEDTDEITRFPTLQDLIDGTNAINGVEQISPTGFESIAAVPFPEPGRPALLGAGALALLGLGRRRERRR